ncbi:hypothetical protein [Flavobacterium saccharophilum]|nr:hypothetical protein [Flavobacterium saccharophilum]
MKKLFLLMLFLVSTILFAQTKNKKLFCADSTITSFSFVKVVPSSISDYKKLLNSVEAYSIYNPKPGFEPTKIKLRDYYSLTNTNKLLKREMSNIEPAPIFPDQERQKSFGQAIFEGVVNSILD